MKDVVYFASDFHLGIPNRAESLAREKRLVAWMKKAAEDATHICLLGDLFDFWFEYRTVIPRGFSRFFGTLAELSDSGINFEVHSGNHDIWMFGYFKEEFGIDVAHGPRRHSWNGQQFLIGHGDGLGPGDHGYKLIKSVFRHPFSQWLYARLHPNLAVGLANYFSRRSRLAKGGSIIPFQGAEKEMMVVYSQERLKKEPIDYFIFGHRHLALDIPLTATSRFLNLGDWLTLNTFARYSGHDLQLLTQKENLEWLPAST